jgi:hypothetical protein
MYISFQKGYCLNKCESDCINLTCPVVNYNDINATTDQFIGGGSRLFSFEELLPYLENTGHVYNTHYAFCFKEYIEQSNQDNGTFRCSVPLSVLIPKLTTDHLKMIATSHNIHTYARSRQSDIQTMTSGVRAIALHGRKLVPVLRSSKCICLIKTLS